MGDPSSKTEFTNALMENAIVTSMFTDLQNETYVRVDPVSGKSMKCAYISDAACIDRIEAFRNYYSTICELVVNKYATGRRATPDVIDRMLVKVELTIKAEIAKASLLTIGESVKRISARANASIHESSVPVTEPEFVMRVPSKS